MRSCLVACKSESRVSFGKNTLHANEEAARLFVIWTSLGDEVIGGQGELLGVLEQHLVVEDELHLLVVFGMNVIEYRVAGQLDLRES